MSAADGDDQTQGRGTGSAPQVFLSHASADTAAALRVVAALELQGIRCWMAPRDVTPGASYASEIVRGIDGSRATVLILSTHAAASPHVLREVERCASKRHAIVCVRLDQAPLPAEFEYFLNSSHWLDATDGRIEAVLPNLVSGVRAAVAAAPPSLPSVTGERSRSPEPPRVAASRPWRASLIALGVAVLAATGLVLWKVASDRGAAGVPSSTTAASASAEKSIAVLPFEDISEQQDQKYFARGIAEEVLGRLAKIPGLKVIGRNSSFRYDTRNADPKAIGKALGVTYLLEGTVRHDGDRVKVSAEMVNADDGSRRWADVFDIELVNVGRMQDTIAAGLARALQISLDLDADPQSGKTLPRAYEFYLRGLQALSQGSESASFEAVTHFQQALALDPKFTAAAVGLGRAYVWIGQEAWQPPRDAFAHARTAVELALKLNPRDARAFVVRADVRRIYDWDWIGARQDLDTAFALAPREADGVQSAALLASALGDWEQARTLGKEALALDPLNYVVHELLAEFIHLPTGRYADAEQELRTAEQFAPRAGNLHAWLGKSLLLQRRFDEALTAFMKETIDDGQLEGSAMAYFAQGKHKESDRMLAAATEHSAEFWASEIARVHAYRGESEQALNWLERAYEQHDEDLWFIKADPFFRTLAGEPRFRALLRKMNLPE